MADSKGKRRNFEINKEEFEKAEERRAKEASNRRKRRRLQRKILTVMFLILFILCALLIFIKTPLFEIDKITVTGNSLVSADNIVSASGLLEGENIFNHTSSYVERQVIKLPYISKVEVKKKYPSEIIINVVEEDVFGVIRFWDKKVAFDRFGKSIKEVTDEEAENLLVFTGCGEAGFNLGEYVSFFDSEKTEIFKRCLKYIIDYDLKNVKLFDIENTKDIYMIIGRGLKVKIGSLGTDDEFSYKMAYIKEVIKNLPENVSGVIDATNVDAGVPYRTEEYTGDEKNEGAKEQTEEEEEKTEENFE